MTARHLFSVERRQRMYLIGGLPVVVLLGVGLYCVGGASFGIFGLALLLIVLLLALTTRRG